MIFTITIKHDRRRYRLRSQRILLTEIKEQYRIGNPGKQIVLESNRPLFRNKGLKHRNPDWKLTEGEMWNSSFLELIIQALMLHLESPQSNKPH